MNAIAEFIHEDQSQCFTDIGSFSLRKIHPFLSYFVQLIFQLLLHFSTDLQQFRLDLLPKPV